MESQALELKTKEYLPKTNSTLTSISTFFLSRFYHKGTLRTKLSYTKNHSIARRVTTVESSFYKW